MGMGMSTLLITDQGEIRDAMCPRMLQELNARPDIDFVGYAVRNLGFVAFRRLEAAIQVHLREKTVSQVALARVFQLLAQEHPERVVLTSGQQGESNELVRGWARAIRRLGVRVGDAQDGVEGAFLRAARDLNGLHATDPLAAFFGRWRERGGQIEAKDIPAVLGRSLFRRHVVVERRNLDGALAVRSVGRGFVTYNAAWHNRDITLKVENHQDYYYGQWVSQMYRGAFADREPRLDDVDVLVGSSKEARQRVRYRRLIVPIRDSGGTTRLLGASVLDQGIDLRVEG